MHCGSVAPADWVKNRKYERQHIEKGPNRVAAKGRPYTAEGGFLALFVQNIYIITFLISP